MHTKFQSSWWFQIGRFLKFFFHLVEIATRNVHTIMFFWTTYGEVHARNFRGKFLQVWPTNFMGVDGRTHAHAHAWRRTTDITQSQKLTMSSSCPSELKTQKEDCFNPLVAAKPSSCSYNDNKVKRTIAS